MRGLLANNPALNYLDLILRTRVANLRALAEDEDREFGASAVEWVVITVVVLVLIGAASAIIIPKLNQKSTDIGTCITNAGNGSSCAP